MESRQARAHGTRRARWTNGRIAALLISGFLAGRFSRSTTEPVEFRDTPALAEATAVESKLDALEAELHLGLGLVAHQEELARRHREVSELACATAVTQNAMTERFTRNVARKLRVRAELEEIRRPATPTVEDDAPPVLEEGGGGEAGLSVGDGLRERRLAWVPTGGEKIP